MNDVSELKAKWKRLHHSNGIVQPWQGNDIDTFRLASQGLWVKRPTGLLGDFLGTGENMVKDDATELLADEELALSAMSYAASVFAKYVTDGQIYIASRDENAEELNAVSWPALIQSLHSSVPSLTFATDFP